MTQQLDRHGTEVRPGDTYAISGGKQTNIADPEFFGEANAFMYDVVLSRADGTPVYRYSGGEDVRRGDEYLNPTIGQLRVMCPEISDGGETKWGQCTLIRRATPPVDERLLIGGDRNGTAVRRGDTVRDTRDGRTMRPCTFMPGGTGWDDWFIQELGPGTPVRYAELVTDEKAERDFNYGYGEGPSRGTPACRSWNERGEMCLKDGGHEGMHYNGKEGPGEVRWSDARGFKAPYQVLESLARALSRPTRAERIASNYAKFDAAVTREVAREPSFSVVTDRSDAELMAWMTGPLGVKLTCLTPADKTLDFEAIAFEWVAALRRMVDEEAGKVARARFLRPTWCAK